MLDALTRRATAELRRGRDADLGSVPGDRRLVSVTTTTPHRTEVGADDALGATEVTTDAEDVGAAPCRAGLLRVARGTCP